MAHDGSRSANYVLEFSVSTGSAPAVVVAVPAAPVPSSLARPIRVTAEGLTMMGTGVVLSTVRPPPAIINAPAITMTGTGVVLESTRSREIHIRAEPIQMTGAGNQY